MHAVYCLFNILNRRKFVIEHRWKISHEQCQKWFCSTQFTFPVFSILNCPFCSTTIKYNPLTQMQSSAEKSSKQSQLLKFDKFGTAPMWQSPDQNFLFYRKLYTLLKTSFQPDTIYLYHTISIETLQRVQFQRNFIPVLIHNNLNSCRTANVLTDINIYVNSFHSHTTRLTRQELSRLIPYECAKARHRVELFQLCTSEGINWTACYWNWYIKS